MNGIAAEIGICDLISRHKKLSFLKFSTVQLLEIAQQTKIGKERLKTAEPYLLQEYGIPLRNGSLHLILESVPSSVILDYVFGIDVSFSFLGWNYALDITTNPVVVEEKYHKLGKLMPMLKELNLERIGVLLLRSIPEPSTFLKELPRNERFCFSL